MKVEVGNETLRREQFKSFKRPPFFSTKRLADLEMEVTPFFFFLWTVRWGDPVESYEVRASNVVLLVFPTGLSYLKKKLNIYPKI